MRLPIGYSDFKKIIDEEFDFVDKSLLIKEIIDDAEAILISRPRRFGKTLNMSMLRYFFGLHTDTTINLFINLKINSEKDLLLKHQGQYPVVYLTFKDVKELSYEAVYQKIMHIIGTVYDEFSRILLNSDKLTDFQKRKINNILEERATPAEVEDSLRLLSKCLYDHYGKKVCILLDEYDTPIQSGHLHGYYNEIVGLFRNLFSAALKDNIYLFKAVLTGILRVSRESLFSGLNNLKVYSVLHAKYSAYFGFTEQEVADLLHQANLTEKSQEIKDWYNGYKIANQLVYNPWSIVNCIGENGILEPYWVNTSDNALVKNLLLKSSDDFKERFELLLEGRSIDRLINENFVFPDLKKNSEGSVWSLLLMTGYLTIDSYKRTDQGPLCQLVIPNREIRNLYRGIIEQWLSNGFGVEWYNQFLQHLLNGDMAAFDRSLKHILEQTISSHDVSKAPESFYHGLMIGLTASLYGRSDYETKSNRESGYGRYDYMILSRDLNKPTILFEFKKIILPESKLEEANVLLNKSAQEALKQIDTRAYLAEVKQRGIKNILKISISFSGKRFSMVYEWLKD
jgi:Predicted AAA-ATPase/PD-(D/E)XK nuclease superfamily